jgi:hypothetical protein
MSTMMEQHEGLYENEEQRLAILDSDTHLAKFGFKQNFCDKCGKKNSEIDGKLIQCGKCRKRYYCSRKCFNNDLQAHIKTGCETSELPESTMYFNE